MPLRQRLGMNTIVNALCQNQLRVVSRFSAIRVRCHRLSAAIGEEGVSVSKVAGVLVWVILPRRGALEHESRLSAL